jgi:hypothetical protein
VAHESVIQGGNCRLEDFDKGLKPAEALRNKPHGWAAHEEQRPPAADFPLSILSDTKTTKAERAGCSNGLGHHIGSPACTLRRL